MAINLRDYLTFLFNGGKGIRTNQIDGLVEVPEGSDTLVQLVWNNTTGEWEAQEAPRNTFNNYPWFVLTRDDDPDQVVEAIEYFLANRDSHGNTDMAGQPFRVTGGVRYPRTFQDFPADPSITDVWPEAGPAAWWWGDRGGCWG